MNKKVSSYIFGALLIVFGLIFILSPESAFETIVLIAGISLIVYGGLKILLALKSDNPYASYTVAGSIFSIIFGIILIGNQDAAIRVIPILLGIWLLISGITTLLFLLKTNSDRKLIIRPVLKIIVGAIAFLLPVIPIIATGIVLGVILILSGITTIMNIKDEEVVYKVKVKK